MEELLARLDERTKAIHEQLNKMEEENTKEHERVNNRLNKLERFMYLSMGAVALFEFFTTKLH